jgi:hypothetical protein
MEKDLTTREEWERDDDLATHDMMMMMMRRVDL